MRVCPHCGEALASEAEECPSCGPLDPEDLQETRPFHPSFDVQPPGDLRDTVRQLPAIDDPELDDEITEDEEEEAIGADLRSTLVEGADISPPSHLAATLVDPPPVIEPTQQPPARELGDTLLEIQPRDAGSAAAITFSDAPVKEVLTPDGTGAEPLNFQEFESTKDRSRRAVTGQTAGPPPDLDKERPTPPRTRLPKVLAWITSVTWVALAVVLVTAHLDVPLTVGFLAPLPFEATVLTALPAVLQLTTLIIAARANHTVDRAMRRGSSVLRHFLRLLLWTLLAALPGVGLFLGLFGALRLILRRPPGQDASGLAAGTAACSDHDLGADRAVGWMLVFFTLAWQEEVLVILLTHFQAHLPW